MSDEAIKSLIVLIGVCLIAVLLFTPIFEIDPAFRHLVRTTSFTPPKSGCLIVLDEWIVDEGQNGNIFYWECP